ncbi:hypothetical protein QBZ16_000215 [Prototheca wickerhamii]|uniref:Acyl-CoA dehydrogenase family member 11 n=1 Tax=Prototheca wickerhamii TaxID=3111 RepID=A0AAD9IP81_PROWI|nr:hypothetical protein QBZ16_000215 [Prototheca wickerhamii]
MVLDTSSALRAVSPALALDEGKLRAYLARTLGSQAVSGPLEIKQFSHGQSNPTYFVSCGGRRWVLRKQPPGKVLQSAHAVDREARVMAALAGTRVPVPRIVASCEDAGVLGTPFYLMEHVAGRIHDQPAMPGAGPEERAHVYRRMAETLAALHGVDYRAAGLGDYGRVGGYCARQVKRWTRQYLASVLPGQAPLAEMTSLAAWLAANVPADDADPARTSLTHGDFRLDNMVLDARSGDVLAVLDWELSTLGDPLSDLAYNCLPYHLPRGFSGGMAALPTPLPLGVPTEAEYVGWYCAARGIPRPSHREWHFYLALSVFRAAAILAGVGARAAAGNASSLQAASVGDSVVGARGDGLEPSPRVAPLLDRIRRFVDERVLPAEHAIHAKAQTDKRWEPHPVLEELKAEARRQGLWNLWVPADMRVKLAPLMREAGISDEEAKLLLGPGLSNLEYAHCAAAMARSFVGPEMFNCSAPDTGNMEVLARYGTVEQQRRWLIPLLRGEIRSGFAMTEPAVASSDATNIQSSIARSPDGQSYTINGDKWWTSGAPDPRCKVLVFMGKTDTAAPTHLQQTMILVPMDAPGVTMVRALPVFGIDDAPHGHALMTFRDVVVPASAVLLGEGRGFEIAQGRLGPGRLHHCMRLVGWAERAIELMVKRAGERVAFGRALREHQHVRLEIAESRVELDAARLSVLEAARALDRLGNIDARGKIAAAKVIAPNTALRVIDRAIQMHGGAGVTDVTPLAMLWIQARTLRLADGPDVVHLEQIGKLELRAWGRQAKL